MARTTRPTPAKAKAKAKGKTARRRYGARVNLASVNTIEVTLTWVGFKYHRTAFLHINPEFPRASRLEVGCCDMTLDDWRGGKGDIAIVDEFWLWPDSSEPDRPVPALAKWRAIRDDVVADAERIVDEVAGAFARLAGRRRA